MNNSTDKTPNSDRSIEEEIGREFLNNCFKTLESLHRQGVLGTTPNGVSHEFLTESIKAKAVSNAKGWLK